MPIHHQNISNFCKFVVGFAVFCLAFLPTTPVQAAGPIIGPVATPPGGAVITPDDLTGRQIGITGGITYTVTNLDPSQYNTLYWGVTGADVPSFSYDGTVDSPDEYLDLEGFQLDANGSRAFWVGSSTLIFWNGYNPQPMTLPIRLTLTVSDLANNPIPMMLAGDAGIPAAGVVIQVTGPFKYNLLFEAFNPSAVPALELFNGLHTDPAMDGRVLSNFYSSFYYTDADISGLTAINNGPTVIGEPTTLSASITGGTNVTYSWDFGDGQTGSGAILNHTYADPGTYNASVTATNPANQLTANTTVTVNDLAITALDVTSKVTSDAAFTLNITGTGFRADTSARWNSITLTTTYLSYTELQAEITADLLSTAGTFDITVTNPTPLGVTSNALPFTVYNPVPVLTDLDPPSKDVTSPEFILTVNGTGFIDGAIIRWNGEDLVTTFISGTQLTAVVPAERVAVPGVVDITVQNPSSSGPSNTLEFTIQKKRVYLPMLFR